MRRIVVLWTMLRLRLESCFPDTVCEFGGHFSNTSTSVWGPTQQHVLKCLDAAGLGPEPCTDMQSCAALLEAGRDVDWVQVAMSWVLCSAMLSQAVILAVVMRIVSYPYRIVCTCWAVCDPCAFVSAAVCSSAAQPCSSASPSHSLMLSTGRG